MLYRSTSLLICAQRRRWRPGGAILDRRGGPLGGDPEAAVGLAPGGDARVLGKGRAGEGLPELLRLFVAERTRAGRRRLPELSIPWTVTTPSTTSGYRSKISSGDAEAGRLTGSSTAGASTSGRSANLPKLAPRLTPAAAARRGRGRRPPFVSALGRRTTSPRRPRPPPSDVARRTAPSMLDDRGESAVAVADAGTCRRSGRPRWPFRLHRGLLAVVAGDRPRRPLAVL